MFGLDNMEIFSGLYESCFCGETGGRPNLEEQSVEIVVKCCRHPQRNLPVKNQERKREGKGAVYPRNTHPVDRPLVPIMCLHYVSY